MHDPHTLAFEIKYPWWQSKPWPARFRFIDFTDDRRWTWEHSIKDKKGRSEMWPEGYRETFLSIWHVDPEKDCSDDSCGWSWPKITKRQRLRLHYTAWGEGRTPHFLCCAEKEWDGTVTEAYQLMLGMTLLVDRVLRLNLKLEVLERYALGRTHLRDCIKVGSEFCYVPGYHSNNPNDNQKDRERHFEGLLCGVARGLLDLKRPWWKHPKWHFWHWKFQCHPLGNFKRWAFSRCCKCGGRFSWGYAPVTNSWNGTGPLWFRSERDTFHADCSNPKSDCMASIENSPEAPAPK